MTSVFPKLTEFIKTQNLLTMRTLSARHMAGWKTKNNNSSIYLHFGDVLHTAILELYFRFNLTYWLSRELAFCIDAPNLKFLAPTTPKIWSGSQNFKSRSQALKHRHYCASMWYMFHLIVICAVKLRHVGFLINKYSISAQKWGWRGRLTVPRARAYAMASGLSWSFKSATIHSWASLSLNVTPTAAPAGLTCLKDVAAGRPSTIFNSWTNCQPLRASSRLM